MSLMHDLDALKAQATNRIPADALGIMAAATAELDAGNITDGILKVGERAPDFALPNAAGKTVTLQELLTQGPLILNFYRGGWCPYCNLELKAYQDRLSVIKDAGGSLAAISPELPDNSLTTVEKNGLSFPVLSDTHNHVAEAFGLVFTLPEALTQVYAGFGINLPGHNGEEAWRLPIPATFVIGTDSAIKFVDADVDYTRRPDPDAAIAALQ